jgi:hypothetical protein
VQTPGSQPATIQPTRDFAIMSAAVYDAVDAIDSDHPQYLLHLKAPRDASQKAAAAQAAAGARVGARATPPTYVSTGAAGDYRAAPPGFVAPVFTHWAAVTPFTLRSGSQLRPSRPAALPRCGCSPCLL